MKIINELIPYHQESLGSSRIRKFLSFAVIIGLLQTFSWTYQIVEAPQARAASSPTGITYTYDPTPTAYIIETGVESLTVEITGASGGKGGYDNNTVGGNSSNVGYITGTFPVTAGIYITIAPGQGGTGGANCQTGSTNGTGRATTNAIQQGGANAIGSNYAGGNGARAGWRGCSGPGGAGGAASVISYNGSDIVAAGGGGGGGQLNTSACTFNSSIGDGNNTPSANGTSTNGGNGNPPDPTATSATDPNYKDGGGGGGGGGGAFGSLGGALNSTVAAGASCIEYQGLGGRIGANSTASYSGLSAGTTSATYTVNNGNDGTIKIIKNLAAPSSFSTSNSTYGSFTLNWGASAAADTFTVSAYTSAGTFIRTVKSTNTNSLSINGSNFPEMVNGSTYKFAVQAIGNNIDEKDSGLSNLFSVTMAGTIGSNSDSDTAMLFTGNGTQAIWASDNSNFRVNDTFTLEAWINPSGFNCTYSANGATGGDSFCHIFGKGNYFSLVIGSTTDSANTGKIGLIWGGGVNYTNLKISTNEWHHVAASREGAGTNQTKIYVDGNLAKAFTTVSSTADATRDFTIGANRSDQVTSSYAYGKFKGAIDEVKVAKRYRTASEITTDMKSHNPEDSTFQLYYDFNENSGAKIFNRAVGAVSATDLDIIGDSTFNSDLIYTSETSTVYTVVKFKRNYLVYNNGWKTPSISTQFRYLLVGGGGGGGAWVGGGGGGGGVKIDTTTYVAANSYVGITVGAGGIGSRYTNQLIDTGTNGSSSSFGSYGSVYGGGVGASWSAAYPNQNLSTVGSGGGASGYSGTSGGAGTSGQGFAGGNGYQTGKYVSGGGGGAGAVGGNYSGGAAGSGGSGRTTSISGSSVTYGGGGGGSDFGAWGNETPPALYSAGGNNSGTGGVGGGGAGAGPYAATDNPTGANGTANLGGGGGGAARLESSTAYSQGGYGGAGIVIIAYITNSPTILKHPTSDTSTVGAVETFTVNTSAAPSPLTKTIKWQYSSDTTTVSDLSRTGWTDVSTGTGFTTDTFTTAALTSSMNKYRYRAIVYFSDTSTISVLETSTVATLTINGSITITSDTSTITRKYGDTQTVRTITYTGGTTSTGAVGTSNSHTVNTPFGAQANGKIYVDTTTSTAYFKADTGTAVGTYYETITVTDYVGISASYTQKIIVNPADTLTVQADTLTAITYSPNGMTINATASYTGFVASDTSSAITLSFSASSATCANGGLCSVGDIGPSGGYVFYVSGTAINSAAGISNGGVYLEAAPVAAQGTAQFGCTGVSTPGTSYAVGAGAANTLAIISNCATAGIAARVTSGLTYAGFSDWFMPSLGEMTAIYENLYRATPSLGGFTGVDYGSSSEGTNGNGYQAYWWFGTGATSGQTNKNYVAYYRPIRAFNPIYTSTINYGPSSTAPSNAGTYTITPSALSLANGVSTSNYVNIVYQSSTFVINKATQDSLTITSKLGSYNGGTSSMKLTTVGGSDTGTVTYSIVSGGSASGCSISTITLSFSSAGTCKVVANKAATLNYLITYSDTVTITLSAFINRQQTQTQSVPTQLPINGANALDTSTVTIPDVTSVTSTGAGTYTIVGTGFSGVNRVSIGGTSVTIASSTSTSINISGASGLTGPLMIECSDGRMGPVPFWLIL